MVDRFVIAGLGNPGPKYAKTRHNAGFWFVDELAGKTRDGFKTKSKLRSAILHVKLAGLDCVLVKPQTSMNLSGIAIRSVVHYYRVEPARLLIAYDELDLPPGTARLKAGGGHGGHNGLRDVFRHMESQDFLRLRIGIGHPGVKELVTPYVLSRASGDQESVICESIARAVSVMPALLAGDLPDAMKALHTEI